jgi:DNA helicase-2/ATP-dependent DNA helicase PcrA
MPDLETIETAPDSSGSDSSSSPAIPTCPACKGPMKKRSSRFGPFWGCQGYPTCRGTRKISKEELTESEKQEVQAEPPKPPPTLPTPTTEEAAAAYDALCKRIDPDQKLVFDWSPAVGNVRVLAAAGSGKTTTTVALVAKLIRNGLDPERLVATTFTSKAGRERAERLARVLPPGTLDQLRVGTFHGLALRALRSSGYSKFRGMGGCMDIGKRSAGIPSSAQLWSKVLGWAGVGGVPGTGAEGFGLEDPDVKGYMLAVDVIRSHGFDSARELEEVARVEHEDGLVYLAKAWEMVRAAKERLGAWDFADALTEYDKYLDVVDATEGTVVLVDEAQDNSEIQLRIAQKLASRGQLILVGDLRQAIYSWRGAFPEMFREADQKIGAKTLELRNNYRSVNEVVEAGNKIAAGKSWNIGESARAARAVSGTLRISGYSDPEEEAAEVASRIAQHAHDGKKLDDIAILTRTNAASAAFEAALVQKGIPCVVVGGTPFFRRYEVQNVLAYIKLSIEDDYEAFARIVNKPRRYLGAKFVDSVRSSMGAGLLEKIDSAIDDLYPKQRDGARELYRFLSELRAEEWPAQVERIVRLLAPDDSSSSMHEADADRAGIVAAVADLAKAWKSAREFLLFAERCAGDVAEARSEEGGYELPPGRVTISTIHKAKGLEWSVVFVSMTAGTFPHARSRDLEEEERLAYVAWTRAKDELQLTWSSEDLRGNAAGPSSFLDYLGYTEPDPDDDDDDGPERPRNGKEESNDDVSRETGQEEGGVDSSCTSSQSTSENTTRNSPTKNEEAEPERVDSASSLFGEVEWAKAHEIAAQLTAAEPEASTGQGGRYTEIWVGEFAALLKPLGFTEAFAADNPSMNQIVFERPFQAEGGTTFIKIYTSIPLGEKSTREVGEDSIKVAAVFFDASSQKTKPLHRKLPYACRTRGWRVTLLTRIEEVAARLIVKCPRCGAPMAERKKQEGMTTSTFFGCVRYPDCRGTRSGEK